MLGLTLFESRPGGSTTGPTEYCELFKSLEEIGEVIFEKIEDAKLSPLSLLGLR